MYSAKSLYKTAAAASDDLIIIGNAATDCAFDAVFNFQAINEALPYKDAFMEKLKTVVKDDEKLFRMLVDTYSSEKSKMALKNCTATADFLTAYLGTDPHLDKIKQQYEQNLENLNAKVSKK